jgi:hypothetical protein
MCAEMASRLAIPKVASTGNGTTYSGVTPTDGTFRVQVWSSSALAEVVDLALEDYEWDPQLDLADDSDGDGWPDASW